MDLQALVTVNDAMHGYKYYPFPLHAIYVQSKTGASRSKHRQDFHQPSSWQQRTEYCTVLVKAAGHHSSGGSLIGEKRLATEPKPKLYHRVSAMRATELVTLVCLPCPLMCLYKHRFCS